MSLKKRKKTWSEPDPRTPAQIMSEEVLLTKPMLAKVLGYRNVRSVDLLIKEDCASDNPCLKPIYLRHITRNNHKYDDYGKTLPAPRSLRFRVEDIQRFIDKMQTEDLMDEEARYGQVRKSCDDGWDDAFSAARNLFDDGD